MEFLIPISLFAMVVAIVYLSYRRKERMAIIERGLDLRYLSTAGNTNQLLGSLKYGLLLVFLGTGLLIANYLIASDVMQEEPAYFALSALSIGLALLVHYFIAWRQMRQNEKDEKEKFD